MNLEELRKHIDEIDEKLFDLLQQRLKLVEQVGHYKKKNHGGKYIIRAGREALKVRKAYDKSREAGYDDKISKAFANLWRELISLSINFEEEAKISFNANNKETLWILREYLGCYSTKLPAKDDSEVLENLKSGKANIAAFDIEAKPSAEPWWLQLSNQTELAVFAAAPIFSCNTDSTSIRYLVSNVTPEPSGEDKFIYVATKIPADEKESFEVLAEYKGTYLVQSDEFYNNYATKLQAKYLGCVAVLGF